jgi:cation-transporting ATPase E
VTQERATAGPGAADTPNGLTAAEVAARRQRGQANTAPEVGARSVWEILRSNVFTLFNGIIVTFFVVLLIVGPIQDTLFGAAVIVNSGIGIAQEWRAKRMLSRLAELNAARAQVRRDGVVRTVAQHEVVLDDVLVLGLGDQVVVDGRVLQATGLEVDESLLTGEADPVPKGPGETVLSGSFVVAGGALVRAERVGADAYAGRLAADAGRFTLTRSELRAGIDRFLRLITWLLVPAAIVLTVSQFLVQHRFADAIAGTAAGLVTMVPEGLVLLTSVAFAVGALRLGRRNCLVQELSALEGLARVDTVCVDKTGTLTEPGMRLASMRPLPGPPAASDAAPHAAPDDGPGDRAGDRPDGAERGSLIEAAAGALAAVEARPNPSSTALAAAYPEPPGWRARGATAFSSARKWSGADFGEHGVWLLGAPEVLLDAGDPALREVAPLAGQGLRVLVLGRLDRLPAQDETPPPVRAEALFALSQQVRPDAADTLAFFARQDVRVVVLSGDNPATVAAVAARLGLPGAAEPVDARTLREPADVEAAAEPASGGAAEAAVESESDSLAARLERTSVFGRVTPARKRAMVAALRRRGHAVAMTGDGVNDVLALKDADIGVAMGSGSPAARSVAQVVLLDDRFATLPYVVAEGRRVIGNIERVASLFLTKTFYALLLSISVGVLRLPFPFLPRHITLVGVITIGVPAFLLALAPNQARVRPGFTARVLRLALPAGLVAGGATLVAYALARAEHGSTLVQDRTTATIVVYAVAAETLAIVARPLTGWRLLMLLASVGAFLLALVTPWVREVLALDASSFAQDLRALAVVLVALVVLPIVLRFTGALPGSRRTI